MLRIVKIQPLKSQKLDPANCKNNGQLKKNKLSQLNCIKTCKHVMNVMIYADVHRKRVIPVWQFCPVNPSLQTHL